MWELRNYLGRHLWRIAGRIAPRGSLTRHYVEFVLEESRRLDVIARKEWGI